MKTLILLGAVAVIGYVAACCWWPFAACLRCGGDGKRKSPTGRSWNRCRRCKGSGERLRVGRRAWNWWSATWSKGAN